MKKNVITPTILYLFMLSISNIYAQGIPNGRYAPTDCAMAATVVQAFITDYPISDIQYLTSEIQKSEIGKSENRISEIETSEIQINITHLPAGIYFVKITTENGVFVKKVIKN